MGSLELPACELVEMLGEVNIRGRSDSRGRTVVLGIIEMVIMTS